MDESMRHVAEAVRRLGDALSYPRYRRIALLSGLAYALFYLYSLGHLVISPGSSPIPGGGVFTFVGFGNIWRERAPYNFEPVGIIQPFEGFAIFLAVPNLLLAATLGLLLGLNISTLVYNYNQARACGLARSFSGVFASLPAFLTGFACCTPTLVILVGASLSASVIGLLQWFMPAAMAALALALVYNLLRPLPAAQAQHIS
ncbi:MAG: hypothetical protein V3W22_01355 [Thermoplasmata archaeon]